MRLLDEQYLSTPFYGYPRMTAWLRRQGYQVNPKRIYRLMRQIDAPDGNRCHLSQTSD